MLALYLFWLIALKFLSDEVNGAHFLSDYCSNTEVETHAYPGVNNVYFKCENGNATIYACPPDTDFNSTSMICSEGNIADEHNYCLVNGSYLPHPFNCEQYIRCFHSEVHIYNCTNSMFYSIDSNLCEPEDWVPACRHKLADNQLRSDLNDHSIDDITNEDQDPQPELIDLVTQDNKNMSNKNSSRKSKQLSINDKKMDINNKPSLYAVNLILGEFHAPYNVIVKKGSTNKTVDDQKIQKNFENLLESYFSFILQQRYNNTPTKSVISSRVNNIFDPNINVFESILNDSITNFNNTRQFPDDEKQIEQFTETLLSSSSPSSSLKETNEKSKNSSEVLGEIQSTPIPLKQLNSSILTSSVNNTASKLIEDTVSSTIPTVNITDNIPVLEQHSYTSTLPSTSLKSTLEEAETTQDFNNDEARVEIDPVFSQHIGTSFSSTTSSSVSNSANIDDDKMVKEVQSLDQLVLGPRHGRKVENIPVDDSVPSKYEDTVNHANNESASSSNNLIEVESITDPSNWFTVMNSSLPDNNHNDSSMQNDQDYVTTRNQIVSLSGEENLNNTVPYQHDQKSSLDLIDSKSIDDTIHFFENIQSDSGNVSEVTGDEFNASNDAVDEVPEEIEKITDNSMLQKNVSVVEASTSHLSISESNEKMSTPFNDSLMMNLTNPSNHSVRNVETGFGQQQVLVG